MAEKIVSSEAHWDGVYAQRDPTEVSWHEPAPEISLALIERTGLGRDAAILDVGGGTSGLARALLRDGYSDVTVADISAGSLRQAQTALGAEAGLVGWVQADVRTHDFGRRYELWHDRAVFHFMVSAADRDAYLEALRRALRPGGHAVLATFGPDGQSAAADCPPAATTPRSCRGCSAASSTRSRRDCTSTRHPPVSASSSCICSLTARPIRDPGLKPRGPRWDGRASERPSFSRLSRSQHELALPRKHILSCPSPPPGRRRRVESKHSGTIAHRDKRDRRATSTRAGFPRHERAGRSRQQLADFVF
jgi:SAM-dependent methyltransferase